MSLNEPERRGAPRRLIVAIAVVVLVIVALHLTGVVGPG
jgi:hypothetical protein